VKTIPVSLARPDPEAIERAAAVIRGAGLVAFPTETVYGLGANALDPAAVERIFAAKGRPSYNPLISHVEDVGAAIRLARSWPAAADLLAEALWPGPLTLVVPKSPAVPAIVTAGLDSVALRVPAHPVALALLRAARLPIAAPSANRFTEVSPTTAAHVAKGLGERVDLILDGGPTAVGIESTVVDLTGEVPVLLRPGSIDVERLEAIVGPIRRGTPVAGTRARPSPGMIERHYAPRAELRIFVASEVEAVRDVVRAARAEEKTVGGLVLARPTTEMDHIHSMPADPAGYARELYAALHRLDDLGCGLIVVEAVPDVPAWAGVRDRLRRASHGR
jgi:L-threonylcarbamoyladenylate synthase